MPATATLLTPGTVRRVIPDYDRATTYPDTADSPDSPHQSSEAQAEPLYPWFPDLVEDQLLDDYLSRSKSLAQIAADRAVPLRDLIDWTSRPDIVAIVERYAQASRKRAAVLASLAAPEAVSATIECMETSKNPESTRRAASAIIRLGKPTAPRRPMPTRGTPNQSDPNRPPCHDIDAAPAEAPAHFPAPGQTTARHAVNGWHASVLGSTSDAPASHQSQSRPTHGRTPSATPPEPPHSPP